MKITVITVTLNAAAVVGDALRSVLAQQHEDVELVLVDGGSSDGTLDVVHALAGSRARVLAGPDAGIYDAMNKGIAAARGDALFFLNADDRLAHPGVLAELAQTLVWRSADLAFGDIVVFDEQQTRLRTHRHVRVARLGHESLSHQAVLARRGCFDRVGSFDTRYRICADLDWFMRCGAAGLRFAYLPQLVCRCMAGGASSRQYTLKMQEARQLVRLYQPPLQRLGQRVAAGLRRRAAELSLRFQGHAGACEGGAEAAVQGLPVARSALRGP